MDGKGWGEWAVGMNDVNEQQTVRQYQRGREVRCVCVWG